MFGTCFVISAHIAVFVALFVLTVLQLSTVESIWCGAGIGTLFAYVWLSLTVIKARAQRMRVLHELEALKNRRVECDSCDRVTYAPIACLKCGLSHCVPCARWHLGLRHAATAEEIIRKLDIRAIEWRS